MTLTLVPVGVLVSSSNAVTSSYTLSSDSSPSTALLAGYVLTPAGPTGPTLTRNGTITNI